MTTDDDKESTFRGAFQRESTLEGTPESPFFYLSTMRFPGTVPLYRFRAPDGSQRFVSKPEERAALHAQGMEEIAKPVYVYNRPVEGASEIFRLENHEKGDLLYTTSSVEKTYLIERGWTQLSSLGYTQSTSSSGTGILWPKTVKLEEADLALLDSPAGDGSRLSFAATNEKIAKLAVGSMLYAPVKIGRDAKGNMLLRQGIMRRVTSVTRNGSGLVVETAQAKYRDLFHDVHLFLDSRPVGWTREESGVSVAPLPGSLPAGAAPKKSFDSLTDYHEPEYLSRTLTATPQGSASASVSFNQDLSYSLGDSINVVDVSGSLGAELTGEINYSAGCSDSIDLLFTSICDQFTVSGTVLFTPSVSASATANVNIGANFSIEKKVLEESRTFEVEGVPVTVTFDLFVGASIADQATATFSASALARGTGGFSASLVVPEVWDSSGSVIGCPNPCPDGFSCGSPDQGYSGSGPTCSVSASANENFSFNPSNVEAKVWVRPEVKAGPGLDDLSASVTFSLENALDFNFSTSQVTGTYELTPTVGYDVGACIWGINVGYSGSTNLAELDVPIFSGGMPAASTQLPSTVGLGTATLTGMVTPTDLNTTAWFIYATNPALTGAAQTAPQSCVGLACNLSFPLAGLTPATDYYYELVAKNRLGTTMGGVMMFHVPTTQTITFPNPGAQTYGVAPFNLNATSSSGLPVIYTVTSGPAVVSGNTLNIIGSGSVTIAANQPGNVDYVPANQVSVTFMVMPEAGNFGSVAIKQSSPVLAVSFVFAPGTQAGSVGVMTQGATGKDYTGIVTSNTGAVVTVNVTFSPLAPGPRPGAVVVYDSASPPNLLGSVTLSGAGIGPQVIFPTATAQISMGSAGDFIGPHGVAVAGNGNVFIGTYPPPGSGYGSLFEVLGTGSYNQVGGLGGSVLQPNALAVDGAGNLYVADQRESQVLEILQPPPGAGYGSAIPLAGGNFLHPVGVAVDLQGNVFVADAGLNLVKEITASSGLTTAKPVAIVSSPGGVAVDPSGNLFVSDTGDNAVIEFFAPNYTTQQTVGSGFSAPAGLAVEASGNVFVADAGNNAIKEILAASGYSHVVTVGSGFSGPTGVALDASGNLYVADTNNNAVKKLDFKDAPILTFASTAVNLVSKDSPKILTVANDGNAPMMFTNNPIVPFGFQTTSATTCPQPGGSSYGGTLAAGTSCNYVMSFVPTEPGSISGSLVLTDNHRNAPGPHYVTQSIKLTGTGLLSAVLTATVTAADKTYDGTRAATITGCSLNGVLPSDQGFIGCSVTSATFGNSAVGIGKTVTAAVVLTGPAASHNTLATPNATALANVMPAVLTVAASNQMIPIGSTVPALTFTYSGFVNGESSSVVTKAPKCSTTATYKSVQGNYPITCSGATAPNYSIHYVAGTLTVSLPAQFVSTQFMLGSGFSSASGVAVDASGNVYVADTGNNAVKEILFAQGYTMITLATGFSSPSGVAVDLSGNLYVSDTGNNAVKEILAAGGYKTINTLGSGFASPTGVAVDGTGNVYVADSGNNAVKEIQAAGGYTTVKTLGNGFNDPTGVALDGSGDVFVADHGNSAVKEILPAGGYTTVNTVGSGLNSPYGVALDANWNVYVTDTGNSVVKEMMAPAYTSVMTLGGGFNQAKGLALDATGNVFVTPGGNNPVQVIAYAPCFPSVSVGKSSLKFSYYFTFLMGGSITAPKVLTQGASSLDFAGAGTGTCTTNGASHVYQPGDSCAVDVIFTPKHPGLRLGSVQLTNAQGALVATAQMSGTGKAPQVVFTSNTTPSTIGSGLQSPNAIAIDGNGNIFVADTGNNAVKEVLAAGGYVTVKTLASGFSSPTSVSVDGDANVFVADTGNKLVKEIVSIGGYTKVKTLAGPFVKPTGVVVDGAGNVFVSDSGSSTVYEILWGGLVTPLSSAFNQPTGLSVDSSGNIFVADTGNNAVKEIVAAGGYATVQTLGSGFSSPNGVAVDASGNLYVADTGNNALKLIAAPGGYATVNTVLSSLNGPTGVALNGSGDVFFSSQGNVFANELPLSKPPALSFGPTAIGSTSTAQTITIENNGNANLLPVFVGTASVPTVSSGFVITGGTCVSMIKKGSTWLTPGASCTLAVAFAPRAGQTGTVTGNVTFSDTHLNLNPATQSIALSGAVSP
jgi:sugar lactone lactonase YvrE